jgi:hypothetical protein
VASKEIGLEVNADKTPNMDSFERVEEFKYLRKTITNQNSVQEEIRKCLISFGEESYMLHIPIKNLKIKICRSIILPVLCLGVKLGR